MCVISNLCLRTAIFIEDILERYDFQYIFERAKKTVASFPVLQHLVEDITCEVYDNFWQKLVKGPVEKPSAYIGRMIHNRCIDHVRHLIHEKCHFVQSNDEEASDMLENIHVTANSEGLRDPAQEFEHKATTEEFYWRVTAAIAKLPYRQQQASAWHLLCNVDDPRLLLELFGAFHIALPVIHPGNKEEEHLLDASFNHAKKALARSLKVDLSQFRQKKRCHFRSVTIEHMMLN